MLYLLKYCRTESNLLQKYAHIPYSPIHNKDFEECPLSSSISRRAPSKELSREEDRIYASKVMSTKRALFMPLVLTIAATTAPEFN